MQQPFWEEAYRQEGGPDTFNSGKPSVEIVDLVGKLPPGARVLDLGCGDGRNALYLAECGFAVTAVDVSPAAIEKVQRLAAARGLTIAAEVRDMRGYTPDGSYHLIIAHGALHFIEREHWSALISRLQAATLTGGYHALTVFTDVLPVPDDLRHLAVGLFREGEVFTLYPDWTLHLQQSYQFDDEHPGSPKHRHALNKLVAEKR